jgi:uncharacterized cupredoxin-like copper-binding protein
VLKLGAPETDALPVVKPRSPRFACIAVAALALLTAACSSSSTPANRDAPRETVRVKVEDFKIVAPKTLAAGTVTLQVHNRGPDMHELLLVRADGASLPLRADDLTVDEDAVKPRLVSVLDDDHPDTDRTWTVRLAPGTYELFCNMSGHYLGGMHEKVVVR